MSPARVLPSGARPSPGAGDDRPDSLDLLPASWRRHLGAIVAACAGWAGAWAVAVHNGRRPLAIERALNEYLINRRPQLGHVADAFVSFNKPVVFTVLMVFMLGLCVGGRSVRAAITLPVALIVTVSLVEVLKHVVGRTNTYGVLTFPSGHVGVTAVLATMTVLLVRGHGPLGRHLPRAARLVLMVVAIGSVLAVTVSVVVLKGHFVTDAIAAGPIGLAVTVLAAAAADALSGVVWAAAPDALSGAAGTGA